MDVLLLFIPLKKSHIAKFEGLIKALLKNGLKISQKKCQLFRTELQYMDNTLVIKERRVCVKPLRSGLQLCKNYSHLQHPRDVETMQEW